MSLTISIETVKNAFFNVVYNDKYVTMKNDRDNVEVVRLFTEIIHRYTEPHRYYHTLNHVCSLIRLARYHGINADSQDFDAGLEIAIIYHDIVYNIPSKQNEEDSVNLLHKHAKIIGINEDVLKSASDYIMITKLQPMMPRTLMTDLDLYGLADGWIMFSENTKRIASEYTLFYTLDEFIKGRLEFWNTFLQHGSIYTDRFRSLSDAAYINIYKEISFLEKGTLP